MNSRRSPRWWVSTLGAGVSVAMAFAVVAISDAAPASVQIAGTVPAAGPAPAYDIVVRPPPTAATYCRCVTSPADLTTLTGGITLAQYDTIRRLPGIQVAAPMTMVGYVPLTVNVPIEVPAAAIPGAPRPVTLTVRLRSDNGLSTVTWDDVTTANPVKRGVRGPAMVSVGVSWTFELPLVAVDPVAEARLMHLDGAVSSGSYLSVAQTHRTGAVPLLIAGTIAAGEEAEVSFDLPSSASVSTFAVPAAEAYSELVGAARENPGTVRTYWTATPVTYAQAADGELVPRPVAVTMAAVWSGPYEWAGTPAQAGVLDTEFRALTQHAAPGAGVLVRAVGVFDPGRVTSTPDTANPYEPELMVGADARSRTLLGGRPLATDGDPGGYPSSAASLVMPLADIGAFTGGYEGGDASAPIGVIRVRVTGAARGDAASLERVRLAAQEIVRATGLHVDAVFSGSASTRVVDLPAGLHGRPPLRVAEVWYQSDTRTTVQAGVDRHSMSLSELDLIAGEVVIVWGMWRLMGARRRELATLRALGWQRKQVRAHLLAEFTLTATVACAAAVAAAYGLGTALISRPTWTWLLLSIPAAITVILALACWPLVRTAATVMTGPLRAGLLPHRGVAPAWWRHRRVAMVPRPARWALFRTTSRTLFAMFVIALACAALSLELATRWAFRGATQSWAGRSASWQGTVIDVAAVLIIVTMATVMVADLDSEALRERAAEVRTLRAIGWSARDVTRLVVWNAVRVGLAGGLAIGAFDLFGGIAVAGAEPPRLMAVAALVTLSGVAMSLLGAGLSAALRRAR
jgi:putative ABC transport system permease protein